MSFKNKVPIYFDPKNQNPSNQFHINYNNYDFFNRPILSQAIGSNLPSFEPNNNDRKFSGTGTGYTDKINIELDFYNITHIISLSCFVLWVLIFNILVIIGLVNKPWEKRHSTDIYLIHLSVVDILVGIFVLPLMCVVVFAGYFPFGQIACNLWIYWDYLLIVISSYGYAALMLNYLWMSRFPGSYQKLPNFVHIGFIIGIWLIGNVSWDPAFVHNMTLETSFGLCGYNINVNKYYTLYIGLTGFYFPLVISIFSAIYTVLILRRKVKDRMFFVSPLHIDEPRSKTISYLKRYLSQSLMLETSYILKHQSLARKHLPLILGILLVFIITRLLFYIYFGVGAFVPNVFPPDLSNGVFWIMHSNSALCPLIHILCDSEVRTGIKLALCSKFQIKIQPTMTPTKSNSLETKIDLSNREI